RFLSNAGKSPQPARNDQRKLRHFVPCAAAWYRSWWAYSIYLVLGGFGVWGIVRLRTRQLKEEKKQLEVIVEERTVEIRQQRDEIQVQERKSHSLLLNILPGTVADELKSTGSVQPVGFEEVTVCFTDFVGFTLSSEKLAPDKLVDALNEYFTAFDEIVARYGLEKLKTIGDSYMFASGLPAPRKSHAVDAVLAALEMVEVVKSLALKPGGTAWNIRVGLHSGPVVAGVVGIRKFAFDIWGNTVNFAARMESSGVPGKVNMSERTCHLLRELIDCEFRGNVKIKEGRELPMFLACDPARKLSEGAMTDGIPDAFAQKYRQEFGENPKSFPLRQETPDLVETAIAAGRGGQA
ncbi:MAG: adenylate/guanylate cyclase domain-containing protein, partial [Acidobacteriota bacterium]